MKPRPITAKSRPIFVSFSGVDGAGKSTQINLLHDNLTASGFRVEQFAFWDDAAVLTNFREFSSLALFKGEKGVGSPENPVRRRDKNVRSWYMTGFRLLLYLCDAASLSRCVRRQTGEGVDVVIFDRYLHDELANLPLDHPFIRGYARVLLNVSRRPDIAFVLDADPEAACARKPEYPFDFVRRQRAAYLGLARWVDEVAVIAPGPAGEVQERILDRLRARLPHSSVQFTDSRNHRVQQAV